MQDSLLEEFEKQIDELVRKHKAAADMPGVRGSILGAIERTEAIKEAGEHLLRESRTILGSIPEHEQTPELREQLILIMNRKLRDYMVSLAPESWRTRGE